MDLAKRVLIVEDDPHIAELLRMHLCDEGFTVVHAADGHAGLRELESGRWDAMVLDVMLPGVDGLEIFRRARAITRYTPIIIIISTRSSEVHRILGLELVARVRALLRRTDAMARIARIARAGSGRIDFGNLCIDPLERSVQMDGKPIELTPREFDLLYFFARHPGQFFSRLDLLNQVWGYQHDGYEHMFNTHINHFYIGQVFCGDDPAYRRAVARTDGSGAAATRTVCQHIA